jgi:GTP-binding protein LepA
MDYEFKEACARRRLAKMDILRNGDKVDALSIIVHRSQSVPGPSRRCQDAPKTISRQMYDISHSGSHWLPHHCSQIDQGPCIERDCPKCYGGDISRKRSFWTNKRN